jgi:hypothetical protein
MEAVNVSVQNTTKKQQERIWLLLTNFERDDTDNIKYFPNNDGSQSILAKFKITRGEWRGQIISHFIPISGDCSGYGRRFIRDIMEASGIAERGNFQSYSINDYSCLIKLHFPAYLRKNGTVIEHVINPYKSLYQISEV